MLNKSQSKYFEGRQSYKKIFQGNQKYVQMHLEGDPDYFKNLAKGQTPNYLIIGCSDSRVPPNDLTQTEPGEMFIHRNVANQVLAADMNVNSVIQYAVETLKVKDIIVIGHSQCGGITAACSTQSHGGFLDMWLSHVRNTYSLNQKLLDSMTMEKRIDTLVKLNVKEQVKNVWKNPYVQKAWNEGNEIWVHGWVVQLETGLVDEIEVDEFMPEDLKAFRFQFKE